MLICCFSQAIVINAQNRLLFKFMSMCICISFCELCVYQGTHEISKRVLDPIELKVQVVELI